MKWEPCKVYGTFEIWKGEVGRDLLAYVTFDYNLSKGEREEAANLISASPELLEALEMMVERFEDNEQYYDDCCEEGTGQVNADADAIRIAREAIRAAKGRREWKDG